MAASATVTPARSARRAIFAIREGAGGGTAAGSSGIRCLLAEIRLAHPGIQEQARRVSGKGDEAALHHVAAAARLERELCVLLHQQQRHALLGDGAYRLEYRVHDQWRKP